MHTVNFSDWLKAEYARHPEAYGDLAQQSLVVVAVSVRRWRGQRLIKAAEVAVSGVPLGVTAVTTQPRWSLVPERVRAEFDAVALGVTDLIESMTANSGQAGEDDDEGETSSLIFRRGLHIVDAANWPRLVKLLGVARTQWNRLADDLCTEEGYAALREDVAKRVRGAIAAEGDFKVGAEAVDALVAKVVSLVPSPSALRTRFGITFLKLPIRLDQPVESDTPGGPSVALEAIEVAVRKPREALAKAADAFASQLVEPGPDGKLRAAQPTRKTKNKGVVTVRRSTAGRSVQAAGAAARDFLGFGGFVDPELRAAVEVWAAELPVDAGAADAVAKTLRDDDALALACAEKALKVAALARDESQMCAAVAARARP